MSPTPTSDPPDKPSVRKHGRVVLYCLAGVLAMTAAGYAAVPLYKAFCQATGFAGTVSRANKAPTGAPLAQTVTVTFDTNVRSLPWTFKPEQNSQKVQIGASGLAFFTVTNNADTPLTGRASYNVVPEQAGTYFHKLQCFCFSDQTIPAHTTMRFPVVYFIDKQFAADPDTNSFTDLTLSYTFFPAVKAEAKSSKTDPGLGGTARAGL